MNNIYTPEFIKLASHPEIQKILEPEVGMCVILRSDRKPSVIVKTSKRYFDARMRDGSTLLGADKQESILLPTLSWLVEKLRESGYPTLEAERDESPWWCAVFGDDGFAEALECGFADTPELACLKALCKIKKVAD